MNSFRGVAADQERHLLARVRYIKVCGIQDQASAGSFCSKLRFSDNSNNAGDCEVVVHS